MQHIVVATSSLSLPRRECVTSEALITSSAGRANPAAQAEEKLLLLLTGRFWEAYSFIYLILRRLQRGQSLYFIAVVLPPSLAKQSSNGWKEREHVSHLGWRNGAQHGSPLWICQGLFLFLRCSHFGFTLSNWVRQRLSRKDSNWIFSAAARLWQRSCVSCMSTCGFFAGKVFDVERR